MELFLSPTSFRLQRIRWGLKWEEKRGREERRRREGGGGVTVNRDFASWDGKLLWIIISMHNDVNELNRARRWSTFALEYETKNIQYYYNILSTFLFRLSMISISDFAMVGEMSSFNVSANMFLPLLTSCSLPLGRYDEKASTNDKTTKE